MEMGVPAFRFRGAKEYAFTFDHAELLLLTWDRDDAKFLFRIDEKSKDEILLDYPGETFSNRVLDAVSTVFFIHVEEGTSSTPRPYVLGSYFHWNQVPYGAYYERDTEARDMVLFRFEGEGPQTTLEPISGEEYRQVSSYFIEHFL